MPTFSFANTPSGGWPTLVGTITSSATSLTVSSASAYPQSGSFVILIDNELMLVTGGQGTTTLTVTRGYDSTTAAAHGSSPANPPVYCVPSAAVFQNFLQTTLGISPQTKAAAPTLALGSAGNLTANDLYHYYIGFVDTNGETVQGTVATITIGASASQVNLTNIPTGAAGTTARRIYRSTGFTGPAFNPTYNFRLVGQINDNVTTSFTDNMSDTVQATQPLAPWGSSSPVIAVGQNFTNGSAPNYSGNQSGTVLGFNLPATFGGMLLDFELAGVSAFSVNRNGLFIGDGSARRMPLLFAGGNGQSLSPPTAADTTNLLLSQSSSGAITLQIQNTLFTQSTTDYFQVLDDSNNVLTRIKSTGTLTASGYADAIVTKTTSYTLTTSDGTVVANAASLTFTLPAPATAGAGRIFRIKNNNQTTTVIKTNTTGVTIDGTDYSSTGYNLNTAYGSVTVQTDGTNWYFVAKV